MNLEIEPSPQWLLATTMVLYVIAMYAIGYFAQRKI
jgi:hypothetical protein